MKKVVSAAARPFRAIGARLRPALRLVRRALVGLGRLRGRTRIVVYAALGLLLVVVVLVLKPSADEEEKVREQLDRYAQATREKDYQTICDDVYARDLVDRVRAAGLPCEVALRTGLEDRQNPQLRVLAVEVDGEQALAKVRSTAGGEVASVDTVRLVKDDGEWRVAALTDPGASLQTP